MIYNFYNQYFQFFRASRLVYVRFNFVPFNSSHSIIWATIHVTRHADVDRFFVIARVPATRNERPLILAVLKTFPVAAEFVAFRR